MLSATFFADKKIVEVKKSYIDKLKKAAKKDPLKRARLCLHMSHDDKVQEMVIVFCRDSYIRPHKHLRENESFCIIDGRAEVIFFDDDGGVINRIKMGTLRSGRAFVLRLNTDLWHSVIPLSKYLIIKEASSGPYKKGKNLFAPWAPDYDDTERIRKFLKKLVK